MKGEKKEYQNKKRLYLLGLCGVLAISGAVYAGTRKNEPNKGQKELVDLNEEEQGNPVKDQSPTTAPVRPTGEPVSLGEDSGSHTDVAGVPTAVPGQITASGNDGNQNRPTPAVPAEPTKAPVPTVHTASDDGKIVVQTKPTDTPKKPDDSQEIAQVNNPTAKELRFSEEDGLGWPLSGNVIKNYSADKLVYFETLGQFKTNPCIFIEGKKGSEIVAAADGIVMQVKKEDKTGQTIVMDIGDGYTLTYGQLAEIAVKEGDYVKAGEPLAKLATVTKYYRMEGEHLYFKVQKDGQNVNPMTLIRSE